MTGTPTDAIVAMAHALNLKVVAKCVETEDRLSHLKDLGCDYSQGYLFSKPLHALAVLALVLNPDNEYFPSPLRRDLRPMDGIYHATFVSARMHWAMSGLIESGQLDIHERETAEQARIADQKNFNAGYEIIAAHAQLTYTGEQVMANAKKYMCAI